jgi:hypothetical protein
MSLWMSFPTGDRPKKDGFSAAILDGFFHFLKLNKQLGVRR